MSWIYIAFGAMPLVAGLFYGIKPAVTAIVVQAAYRIGSRAFGPLIISIDTKGNNLIEHNKERFNQRKVPVMEKIFSRVRFIK